MNQEWEKKVRGEDFHFTCATCFETFNRLFLEWIDTMPKDLPPEDQIARITNAIEKIDDEVRALSGNSKS